MDSSSPWNGVAMPKQENQKPILSKNLLYLKPNCDLMVSRRNQQYRLGMARYLLHYFHACGDPLFG